MTGPLASDMVRNSLRPFIERAEQPNGFSPDEARDLLANCAIPTLILEHLWQRTQRRIDQGIEQGELVLAIRELLELLEWSAKAFGAARTKVGGASLGPEEKAAGIARLESAGQDLVKMRGALIGLLHRLETLPPVDPSSLPAASGERPPAGYVGLNDLAARLRSHRNA